MGIWTRMVTMERWMDERDLKDTFDKIYKRLDTENKEE